MNNANVGGSGAEWVPVVCLLATGASLGLSTNLAKLAGCMAWVFCHFWPSRSWVRH